MISKPFLGPLPIIISPFLLRSGHYPDSLHKVTLSYFCNGIILTIWVLYVCLLWLIPFLTDILLHLVVFISFLLLPTIPLNEYTTMYWLCCYKHLVCWIVMYILIHFIYLMSICRYSCWLYLSMHFFFWTLKCKCLGIECIIQLSLLYKYSV